MLAAQRSNGDNRAQGTKGPLKDIQTGFPPFPGAGIVNICITCAEKIVPRSSDQTG